jgi:hypothetical protein
MASVPFRVVVFGALWAFKPIEEVHRSNSQRQGLRPVVARYCFPRPGILAPLAFAANWLLNRDIVRDGQGEGDMSIRGFVVMLAAGFVFLAGLVPVRGADVPPDVSPAYYTYFSLEGGYINFDAEKVQAFRSGPDETSERFLDLSDGLYGRAELGRVWDTGAFNGLGAYLQGWQGDEDTSETDDVIFLAHRHDGVSNTQREACDPSCAVGRADLDRSMFEVGLRFFHEFGEAMELDGVALGIEPFVAFIGEDTDSEVGDTRFGPYEQRAARSSDLDATAYGALLALDARYHVLAQTMLTARAAGGAYYMDAEVDTDFRFTSGFLPSVSNGLSSDFFGLRGQLALGVEHFLTEASSIGVIGRLDYWSDYPSMDWTDAASFDDEDASNNSIAEEHFLALSIGARLSFRFGM